MTSNQLPSNSCLIIDNWQFYNSFDYLGFDITNYQRIEIQRQLIQHFEFGNLTLKEKISNPINYSLLSNSFTDEQKNRLNEASSDVMIRLYMKCCELGMFDINQESGNSYFPYFPEHITAGTIVFIKSDPYT